MHASVPQATNDCRRQRTPIPNNPSMPPPQSVRAIEKTTGPNAGAVAAMPRISSGNVASNLEKERHIFDYDLPKSSLRVLRQSFETSGPILSNRHPDLSSHGLLSRPIDKPFQFVSPEDSVNQMNGVPAAEATRSPPQRRTSPPTLTRRPGREAFHRKFREPVDARPKAAKQPSRHGGQYDDTWGMHPAESPLLPAFSPYTPKRHPSWEASRQAATAAPHVPPTPKGDGTLGVHRGTKRSGVTHTISEDCSDERVLHKRRLVALRGTARGTIPKKVDKQGPGPAHSTSNNDFADMFKPPPLPSPLFVPIDGPLDPNMVMREDSFSPISIMDQQLE